MSDLFLFEFKTDISTVAIPKELNNPFGVTISEIARIAVSEFQEYISAESSHWGYDFNVRNGKMFGVLVVQKEDGTYAFLGTVSGTLSAVIFGKENTNKSNRLVPSVFDDTLDNYFFSRGMIELTEIGKEIKISSDASVKRELKEKRRLKSIALQQRLFENYVFSNIHGVKKNVLQIFDESLHGKPPAAAGECAAPKLLEYAANHQLKAISLAEFWWGNPIKTEDRVHKNFYPACKNKCRPILEYILDDKELFDSSVIE